MQCLDTYRKYQYHYTDIDQYQYQYWYQHYPYLDRYAHHQHKATEGPGGAEIGRAVRRLLLTVSETQPVVVAEPQHVSVQTASAHSSCRD